MLRKCLEMLAAMLFFVLAAASCREIDIVSDPGDTELLLKWESSSTRSSYNLDENKIESLIVYIYKEGVLFDRLPVSKENLTNSSLRLTLHKGYHYSFYILANLDDFDDLPAPKDETFLKDMRLYDCAASAVEGGYAPMAGSMENLYVDRGVNFCIVELDRLVSRLDFVIDKSGLQKEKITVKSVRLRQAAADICPFLPSSEALTVYDGDYASSEDLENINSGGKISFYMLENAKGVLLPGNQDHWAKIPDNISSEASFCTYLEVSAVYTAPGILGENLKYRLYLGEDNCSDFNVGRNKINTLTLTTTGEGVFRSSWKVELGEYVDSRELHFSENRLEIHPLLSDKAQLRVLTSPEGLAWHLDYDNALAERASLNIDGVAGAGDATIRLSCDFYQEEAIDVPIYLLSLDGVVKDSCVVHVYYKDPSTTGVDFAWEKTDGRMICAQKDVIRFEVRGKHSLEDFMDVVLKQDNDNVRAVLDKERSCIEVSALREGVCELTLSLDGIEFRESVEVRKPVMRFISQGAKYYSGGRVGSSYGGGLKVPVDGSYVNSSIEYYDPYFIESMGEDVYTKQYTDYDKTLAEDILWGNALASELTDGRDNAYVAGRMCFFEFCDSFSRLRLKGVYEPELDETLESMFGDFSSGDIDCGVIMIYNTKLGISCRVPVYIAYPFPQVHDLGEYDCYGFTGRDAFCSVIDIDLSPVGGVVPSSCSWRFDRFPSYSNLNAGSTFEYIDGMVNIVSPIEDCAGAPCGDCYLRMSVRSADGYSFFSFLYPFHVRQHLAVGGLFNWSRIQASVHLEWYHTFALGSQSIVDDSVGEILACGPERVKGVDFYQVDNYLMNGTFWTEDYALNYMNTAGPLLWLWNNPDLGGDDSVVPLPAPHPSNPWIIVHRLADFAPLSNGWLDFTMSD